MLQVLVLSLSIWHPGWDVPADHGCAPGNSGFLLGGESHSWLGSSLDYFTNTFLGWCFHGIFWYEMMVKMRSTQNCTILYYNSSIPEFASNHLEGLQYQHTQIALASMLHVFPVRSKLMSPWCLPPQRRYFLTALDSMSGRSHQHSGGGIWLRHDFSLDFHF